MIPLHRLTHPDNPLYINPDMIQAVESTPDTVIAMTNGSRLVVAESADRVIELICGWRASIYARALGTRRHAARAARARPGLPLRDRSRRRVAGARARPAREPSRGSCSGSLVRGWQPLNAGGTRPITDTALGTTWPRRAAF